MSNKFSACTLTSKFSVSDVNLNPGQCFPHLDPEIRLAGGFSSLFPETKFHLSPTLQLNNDLSTLSHEQLEGLAHAELYRANNTSFKSYVVDPNMHVCVLADDPEKLEAFLDTYGGILEVEPLLVKGSHPDHDQVTEVQVTKGDAGYAVAATLRAPVDKEVCTYCGACGPACPESCISPELRVEYSDCTFCRECENICPVKAIDIYSVEKKTVNVPAVILLGDIKLDLPEDVSAIYNSESLVDYFSTLFSVQIEEVVQCNSEICQYSTRLGKGCDLCYKACPAGAISQGKEGVVVDYQLCDECGSCSAVCPTGAMQFDRFEDAVFAQYFKHFALPMGATVIIGDEENLHSYWWHENGKDRKNVVFLEHPEVDGLSLFHFLSLVSQGAGQIIVIDREGDKSSTQLAKSVEQFNLVFGAVLGDQEVIQVSSVSLLLSGTGPKFDTPQASLISERHADHSFNNRRDKIASLLSYYHGNSEGDITLTMKDHGPFATVSCDTEKCTQCFACLNECKIRALNAGDNAMSLTYTSSLCVGCGLCVMVCPEKALAVTGEALVTESYFTDVQLAKAEPMLCKDCGKEFGTKKSFEKVMEILQSKGMADKGHYELCEDCRVLRMFESAK